MDSKLSTVSDWYNGDYDAFLRDITGDNGQNLPNDYIIIYKGKTYFIDFVFDKHGIAKKRSIGEFDGHSTIEKTRVNFDDTYDMLSDFKIDGVALKDFIMDAQLDSIY